MFLQLALNLDRLRVAIDDLLVRLTRCFKHQKQQTVFLINNYDMVLAVFKVSLYTFASPTLSSYIIDGNS